MKNGGLILPNAFAICEMSQTSWQTGNLKMNEDLENHSKDLGAQRDKARIHQFGRKIFPGIFPGYALIARGIWGEDILIAEIEKLGKVGCIKIYPRRLNAKEVLITQEMKNLYFPLQMVPQNYQEESTNSKNPL